jgi:hypothetical protein
VAPDNSKRYGAIVVLLILLLALSLFYYFDKEKEKSVAVKPQEEKKIAVTLDANESNITRVQESNEQENNSTKVVEEKHEHRLRIIPKAKVWVGIVDLDEERKKQAIISEAFDLNGSKKYLLTFGHGYIDIEIDDKVLHFQDPKNLRFLYSEGKLEQLGKEEFRSYNKGKLW